MAPRDGSRRAADAARKAAFTRGMAAGAHGQLRARPAPRGAGRCSGSAAISPQTRDRDAARAAAARTTPSMVRSTAGCSGS